MTEELAAHIQAGLEAPLMLVDDAQAEIDLVGLFECWMIRYCVLYLHDTKEEVSWVYRILPHDLLGSIFKTLENASSACSNEPYLSYSMPMPYHNLGSYPSAINQARRLLLSARRSMN
jgi:hypothetical protein